MKRKIKNPVDRFWDSVVKRAGCWQWVGTITAGGYGQLGINRKSVRAHRFSYTLANGEFPKELYVCHKCDNPACVNPEHLYLGDHRDNMRDKVLRGRQRNQYKNQTHCKHGHKFNEKNTRFKKSGKGRECRRCQLLATWKYRGKI